MFNDIDGVMTDLADDLEEDELPLAPEIVEDEQEESEEGEQDLGQVLDVESTGLARSQRVRLADEQTDWVKEDDKGWQKAPSGPTGDLYRTFVREATRYNRLTEQQERALGLKVRDHADKDAAKKLVVHNLRLALKMAHQYRRSWTNLMDLVQEASAGMAIAAERWDPDQGTRYGTYAVYWIRAQLTKFLMRNGRVIHTGNTRAGRKLYYQLPRIRRRLLADGKDPSIANIAKEVGEDEEEVARVVARLDSREASLSAQTGDSEGGTTLGDLIEGDLEDPEAMAGTREIQELMEGLVQRFAETIEDERDRAIWVEHLTSGDPTSLVELGKRYGVSKQRMGQLATRLKRAFRRHVIDELGPQTQLSWLFQRE